MITVSLQDPVLYASRGAPRGSKHPNSRVSGSKNHSEYGFWDLKPYIWVLGPSGASMVFLCFTRLQKKTFAVEPMSSSALFLML